MDTIEKTTIQRVTIDARELTDLLTGAFIVTDKGKNARENLAGVYLSVTGNTFKIFATDRYRLVQGFTRSIRQVDEVEQGVLEECFIPNDSIKAILSAIKGVQLVELTREDNTLTIKGSTTLTIDLINHTMPQINSILEKIAGDEIALSKVCLSPKLLADFAKIPTTGEGMRLSFYGEKTPVKIDINHDLIEWVCLIMPMRDIK